MFKKALCLVIAAASLFALCSCDNTQNPDEGGSDVQEETTFGSFVISKDNTNLVEKLKDLAEYGEDSYCLLKYEDKQYIAKQLKSGNYEALCEMTEGCTVLDEATKRAGGSYIYFTDGSSLKAYFIPTDMVMTVVNGICSNFELLNVPESFEIYPYGFVATASEINVVSLANGSISSYSKTLSDVSTYIEAPSTFKGEKIKTTLTAHSKTQLLISVATLNSKGEEKEKTEFTFNPLLGVFTAVK